MAETYWLSFRIKDDAGYADAYDALVEVLKKVVDTTQWWFETTSFYVFRSNLTIGDLALRIKGAIRTDRDLVVLGMPDYKSGRVIGNCEDQDIFELIPFMKKA